MNKPNCYDCKFRGTVAGSCHSSCKHPAFESVRDNELLSLLSILGSVGRAPAVVVESEDCKVRGNAHGIRSGWFQHPFNFDPVWLESCTGFTPKASA